MCLHGLLKVYCWHIVNKARGNGTVDYSSGKKRQNPLQANI